jgi:NAD(P)-dependent dehydrogenase (short-subunit alcohol dehydrogenase family)
MPFSLQHKTALITGGASGIGLAIAQLFAQQGARVHILELNHALAMREAGAIRDQGGDAVAHAVNVANQQDLVSAVDAIAAAGPIDILVNNAGIAHIGNAETTTEADFDRIVSVNIKGTYNCLHAVLPHMKRQGKGVILNMASVAATVGLPDRFAYSMSKGAVISMTLSVAKDYIKHGIRCNCISPARVHTPFVDGYLQKTYPGREKEMFEKLAATQPIGRMAEPSEIAGLALYLCSEEAGFITGCDYPIDGGFIRLNN